MLEGAREEFRQDPSRLALIDGSTTWTWSELTGEIARIAKDLARNGGTGPVEIHLPSGVEFLATFLAASESGRPACTLHTDWAGPELEAAKADVRDFDPGDPGPEPDPLFYVGFTSGTSGRPKPFARRARSWSSSFGPAGELFGIEPGDVVHLPGSLQHSHFLFGAVLALNRGAAVRLHRSYDARIVTGELDKASRAVVYLVPTMLLDLDESATGPFSGVHSLVISGAKMETHHWEIARRLFPEATIGEIYGASELSFVSVNTEGGRGSEPGFVGRLFPGVEVEIRPTDGRSGDGSGLVYVRSPYLFEGYVEGSGIFSPVGDDGFMTVGDIGRLEEDRLYLSGRASNLLITGGKNVHPEEVEAILSGHGTVSDCVVIGVPHPRWGEELVAFLAPADPGEPPDPETLRTFLKERLASYKVPKRWLVLERIPRTRLGKTDRTPETLFRLASPL